jgi:hypothetical protein
MAEVTEENDTKEMAENYGGSMKLRSLALGISLGTVWGTALFLTTWLSYFTGYARLFLEALPGSLYPGYTISPHGSLVALLYGFVDLLVMGLISGWLYNRFIERKEKTRPERR